MSQTIEGLVECHRIARDRAQRGLPSWKGTLGFMAQLKTLAERHSAGDDDLTASEMLAAFRSAAEEIRAKVPEAKLPWLPMEHEDLEYFLDTMEGWTVEYIENADDILGEFDNALDRFADWCDVNRWWIAPA